MSIASLGFLRGLPTGFFGPVSTGFSLRGLPDFPQNLQNELNLRQ
jgi:hypothetical protein